MYLFYEVYNVRFRATKIGEIVEHSDDFVSRNVDFRRFTATLLVFSSPKSL